MSYSRTDKEEDQILLTIVVVLSAVFIAAAIVLWGFALAWAGREFFQLDIAWWKWALGWTILATGYKALTNKSKK